MTKSAIRATLASSRHEETDERRSERQHLRVLSKRRSVPLSDPLRQRRVATAPSRPSTPPTDYPFMRWYAGQVASRQIDPQQMPGSARNPHIAVDPDARRRIPVGSFYLDDLGDTYWQCPGGPRLAGRTGNGSPMVGISSPGRLLQEVRMQIEAAARGAADYASLGSADESEALRRTIAARPPPFPIQANVSRRAPRAASSGQVRRGAPRCCTNYW